MKSKMLPSIYRIFALLTFACGAVMMFLFAKFASYAIDDANIEDVEVARSIGNFGYSFFVFLIMIGICFILSIVCFKAYKPVASVIRTLFTAIAGGVCCIAIKIMIILIDIKKYYVDNEINLDYIENYDLESEIYKMFLPLASFVIILIIAITSIVALAKGPIISENNTDEFSVEM